MRGSPRAVDLLTRLRLKTGKIEAPAMLIQATQETVLLPELAQGMPAHFKDLTIEQVDSGHWALWEKPQEVNDLIEAWLKKVL